MFSTIRHHHDASAPETFTQPSLAAALVAAEAMCRLSGVSSVIVWRDDVVIAGRMGKVPYDESVLNDCGA